MRGKEFAQHISSVHRGSRDRLPSGEEQPIQALQRHTKDTQAWGPTCPRRAQVEAGGLAECLSRLGTATWALEARPPQGTPRPHQGLLGTRTPDAPPRKRSNSGAEGSGRASRGRPRPPPGEPEIVQQGAGRPGGLSHRGGGRCVQGVAGPLEAATRHPMGAHAEPQLGVRKGTGNDQPNSLEHVDAGMMMTPAPSLGGSGRRGQGPLSQNASIPGQRGCRWGGESQPAVKPWGGCPVPRVPRVSGIRTELPPTGDGGTPSCLPTRAKQASRRQQCRSPGALQETWRLPEPRGPLGGDRLVARSEGPGRRPPALSHQAGCLPPTAHPPTPRCAALRVQERCGPRPGKGREAGRRQG